MHPKESDMDVTTYERPRVEDYGSLRELTGACFGTGASDELGKDFAFTNAVSQPLNGDDRFCVDYP
jgi:hypothetical protein